MKNSNIEYINEIVPAIDKRSFLNLLPIWIGFILVVGVMSIGSGLAAGMEKNEAITAILFGNFILGIIAAISGFVGAHSGKSFSLLVSDVFKSKSAKIVSLYAPITLIGWYAVQTSIFGNLLSEIFGIVGIFKNIAIFLSAILFSITCYFGFRTLGYASMFLVPIVIILATYAIWSVSGSETLSFAFGDNLISFETGFSLVVGSWVLGVVASLPDISRFSKTPYSGALLGFFGIFIFNSLGILTGLFGAAYIQNPDPAVILIAIGAPILALILGIANIWTTNDNNLYSASLGISHALQIDRRKIVVVIAAIGALIAFFEPSNFSIFFTFLFFLGNTAPALGGVILGSYLYKINSSKNYKQNSIAGWSGWIIGSIVSSQLGGVYSIIFGALVAFFLWMFIHKIMKTEG